VAEIQRQLHEDFAPVWHMDAIVTFSRTQPADGAWAVRIVPGGAHAPWGGYHLSVDNHGTPYADVFDIVGEHTDRTLSHEILEMTANPYGDRYIKDFPYVWNFEVADPVQKAYYTREGVQLSDFVYPAWFSKMTVPGTRLDFLGKVHEPCHVLPGGVAVRINFTTGIYERFTG
jgi:hypothetical protein